jgi:hypothetical protein
LRAAVRRTLAASAPSGGWAQQAKLTASDAARLDFFGGSVAIYKGTAVVGAPLENSEAGAAYVFVRSGTGWSQQAKLTPSHRAANDLFGDSVAIFGSTVIVGAPGDDRSGAAYVFVRSGSAWSRQAKLTAPHGLPSEEFGQSVAISGCTAVVGAFGKNHLTGAAFVFVRSGTAWSQQNRLTASDGAEGDNFGVSVAISGSTAVVGADTKNSNTGAAYVFVRSGKGWSQQAELTAADAAAGDEFGYSVAISGSTAVIGAPLKYNQAGAAYVFVRSGTSWSQQAELTDSHGLPSEEFGQSVAISGCTAVVGALGKNESTGAAFVFARSGTAWAQQAKLTALDAAFGDEFGTSVAISGSTAVIGAPDKNNQTGAAYVFANG